MMSRLAVRTWTLTPRYLVINFDCYPDVTQTLANLKLARAQIENPTDLIILACGGDGTVWSVIQAVFEVNLEPRPKVSGIAKQKPATEKNFPAQP